MGLFSKFMSWLDDVDSSDSTSHELTFGTYDGTPIVWIPVCYKNSESGIVTGDELVTPTIAGVEGRSYITKNVLFNCAFNKYNRMSVGEYNIWKYSPLRQYLNGEFYDICFNDEEKSRIITCKVKSYSNTKEDAYRELYVDQIETIDKIYLPNDKIRLEQYEKSLDKSPSTTANYAGNYWTRMIVPYENNLALGNARRGVFKKKSDNRQVIVTRPLEYQLDYEGGYTDKEARPERVDNEYGVRPVIFIKNSD